MTKHTPHNEEHQWIAVGNMVEYTNDEAADICSCDPQSFGQEALAPSYEEQAANARLIAMSPVLLEELKSLLLFVNLSDLDIDTSHADAIILAAEGGDDA